MIVMARRAAAGKAKVLITGESGVGKDLVAREIHARSRARRADRSSRSTARASPRRCSSRSCSATSKGSFTGAYRDKPGKLQLAHRGTLFLDEVGEMSLRMQALLLRFLENGEMQAVGADHVDARSTCASSRRRTAISRTWCPTGSSARTCSTGSASSTSTCRRCASAGKTSALLVALPVSKRRAAGASSPRRRCKMLERYRWPGNVRELQNVVEQALWMANGAMVEVAHLPPSVQAAGETLLPAASGASRWPTSCMTRSSRRLFVLGAHPPAVPGSATSRGTTCASWSPRAARRRAATTGRCLRLFGMPAPDYKRFLNFLAAHDCKVDFRAFRHGTPEPPRAPRLLPPLATRRRLMRQLSQSG